MTIRTVRNLRRGSQVFFFFLFLWLVLKTTFDVDFSPAEVSDIRLPYPVSIALEFDPLAALMTLLASGTLYKGLLWSLVILVPTIFLGRFFCGWICPLGTLNHWVSGIKPERKARKGKRLLDSNRYKPYQQIKYSSSSSSPEPRSWGASRPGCWIRFLCWHGPLEPRFFRRSTPGPWP